MKFVYMNEKSNESIKIICCNHTCIRDIVMCFNRFCSHSREGNVIVKSGSNRDNRIGYYFDTKEGKCKQVFYSTGPGCVPPPFKTLKECISCGEQGRAPLYK